MYGDKFRLEHVIANLFSNAIKFSPEGSTVTFKIEVAPDDNVKLSARKIDSKGMKEMLFSVSDEGVGMSKEDVGNLFKPFHQIRPAELQQCQGTGLGLVLAKEIVNQHGGTLTCESVPGKGTCFLIRLPMKTGEGDADTSSVSEAEERIQPATGPGRGNTTRILNCLVVDDTPSNRKMLSSILQKRGFTTSQAEDGQLAVDAHARTKRTVEGGEQALAEPFDIIFMDNTMPVLSGVEACRSLRKQGFQNLIIGVTGNALDDDVLAFTNAGADIVFAKPIRSDQLDAVMSYISFFGPRSSSDFKLVTNGKTIERVVIPGPTSTRSSAGPTTRESASNQLGTLTPSRWFAHVTSLVPCRDLRSVVS